MTIRTIEGIEGTERDITGKGFRSLRLILASDGMGFSLHKTVIPKGGPHVWHYKQHLEACFCIQGSGILTNLQTGQRHAVHVDTVYILDNHDKHSFEALEDCVLVSVFNPPIVGNEIHKADGSYELVKL